MNRTLWTAAAFLVSMVSSAGAVVSPSGEVGSVELPARNRGTIANPERQARLEAGRDWQTFRSRHGNWRAFWNESNESPHRAFGTPIRLTGFREDPASIDAAVRAFVHGNPEAFGPAPGLELLSVRRSQNVWLARYRQTVNGVPVLFSDWDFRIGPDGKLFSFAADVARPGADLRTRAAIAPAVAREGAKQGLGFDPAVDRIEGGEKLYLLAIPTAEGIDHRLVYQAEVRTVDPPGNWLTYVDAVTGAVLWRQNRVRYDISGTVSGTVHANGPNEALVSRPFKLLSVTVGSTAVVTDAAGQYSGAGPDPANVTASLRGPYCDVSRNDAVPDGFFTTSAPNPSTVVIAWGTAVASHDAERDGYYHVNVAHDYVKELEPTFTGLDYVMPCNVNIASACNAFWDGFSVNFFAAGGNCPNTATIPDVVYHEYGHGVNDFVYAGYGSPIGLMNGALHEGLADVYAAFLRDDPVIGRDFGGPGTTLRNVDNTFRWPENGSGDPHITGLIVAGAFWDLRQSIGLADAEHLAHFAKHFLPDDGDDGIAMFEFFEATLLADDDDADLTNGTPHASEIIAAFNAHGIGTVFWIAFEHTPPDDPASGGDIPVSLQVQYTGPIGAIDTGSPAVHYVVNAGPMVHAPLTPTGNPNEYGGAISAPGGSVVRYYVSASDNFGQTAVAPVGAPEKMFTLIVGPAVTQLFHDMEAVNGWVGGQPGDNATTGQWIRADPVATIVGPIQVQPEFDHTPPPGVACWVTGNGAPGQQAGAADVDNGRTTLLSPAFDAIPAGTTLPIVEFYRWYSNNSGGDPGNDFWRVDISNNGGASWTPIENTRVSDLSWRRVAFRVADYVTPTSNMRMRFIAADEGAGSLVEALVDDFRLVTFQAALLPVEPLSTVAPLALAPPSPNPFDRRTTLRFTLPASGAASVRVFDLHGRNVRTLSEGTLPAGPHLLEWDGRDQTGHRVASGAYFVRLIHGGREVVRAVVKLD